MLVLRTRLGMLFALGLAACTRPAAQPVAPGATSSRPTIVTLSVFTENVDGPARQLPTFGVLRNGDRYYLKVGADVRLNLFARRQRGKILAEGTSQPGKEHSLPENNGWLTMDGPPGAESIYVVASVRPLQPDAVEQAIATEQSWSEATQKQCPLPVDPGQCREQGTSEIRGKGGPRDGECRKVTLCLDHNGMGVLRFPINHQ